MQTTISEQIKAVQAARGIISNSDINSALNDAASTLAALNMILSGDIGKEFEQFYANSSQDSGQCFVNFLRSKGLDLTKIK
jgi:autotransporter adhesin